MVYEWNVLRVVACLSIVLLHATTNTEIVNGYIENQYYQFFRLFLCFATPTFILLSITILANRYQTVLPSNFLISRFTFIYLPFIFISFLYAAQFTIHHGQNFLHMLYQNIVFGEFPGWFVLSIMQLYILFFLIKKYKLSIIWLAPVMIFTGILYVTIVNLGYDFVLEHDGFFRMFFLSWVPYFAIAYLLGTYYKQLSPYLVKYKYTSIFLVLVSSLIVYTNFIVRDGVIHSRRIDIILLVLSITLFILAFGQIIPRLKIIHTISRYSFGIFLIHWLVQEYLAPFTSQLQNTFFQVTSLFLLSLIASICIIKIISFIPYSEYLIGKAHKAKND